jgi:hypothetical protein
MKISIQRPSPAALDGFEFSPRFTIVCVTRSTLIQGYWTCAGENLCGARGRVDQHLLFCFFLFFFFLSLDFLELVIRYRDR